jgi:hypothetical protein
MYSQNTNTTALEVISATEISVVGVDEFLETKIREIPDDGELGFQKAIIQDYRTDEEFRRYIDETIFFLDGPFTLAENSLGKIAIPSLSVVMMQAGRLGVPGAKQLPSGVIELNIGTIDVDQATAILEPIWHDERIGSNTKSFVRLILEEKARNLSLGGVDPVYLSQESLAKTLETIQVAIAKSTDVSSVESRNSPIDAIVVDDRLVLSNVESVETVVPLEALEHLRRQYHGDAEKLVSILSGTNAGKAFLGRMENVERTLSGNLTFNSTLILGDQARALEIMLPSVREMLTDSTVSDLSAFVSGLGLFVRQFPAWRDFVNEAREEQPLTGELLDALNGALAILEQSEDKIVDPDLKAALQKVSDARTGLTDKILDFAITRAVGNVFRAVGRYIIDRSNGIRREFNLSMEKSIGQAIAQSAVAGLIGLAGSALLHLAAGIPLEYGWIIGLGILASMRM